MISTRRLRALASSLLLARTGRVSARPIAESLQGLMPSDSLRYLTTPRARAKERSKFDKNRGGGSERIGMSSVWPSTRTYVFELTRSWKFDGFLADMSFPLYLVHWPVWLFIRDRVPVPWPDYPGIVPAAASVIAAAVLVVLVERPVERWRASRVAAVAKTVPA